MVIVYIYIKEGITRVLTSDFEFRYCCCYIERGDELGYRGYFWDIYVRGVSKRQGLFGLLVFVDSMYHACR